MRDAPIECLSETRLRALRRAGMLSVRNQGPALCLGMISHGIRPLDRLVQSAIEATYDIAIQALHEFFETTDSPERFDVCRLIAVVDGLRNGLVGDIDAALDLCRAKNNDPTLALHAVNVALLSMAIGIDLGYDERHVQAIGMAALVNDVGMLRVSDNIRSLDRKLTQSEALDIQRHPVHSVNILSRLPSLPSLVQLVVYQVHERPDGSGYPRGRDRISIHPFARIIHVADAFLALTSVRPYRPPVMSYEAMVCLLKQAEQNQVETEVVRSLLEVLSLFPIGSFVELSDRRQARVVRARRGDFTRPIVDVGDSAQSGELLDLSMSTVSVTQALPTPGSSEVPLSAEIANWRVRAAAFLTPERENARTTGSGTVATALANA
jgi:HD-GYP domain-containing protein (c-di-GMP phosphodiesterase class II)